MTKKVFLSAILVFCVSISSVYASEKNIEKSANLQNNFPNIFRPIGNLVKRIFGREPKVIYCRIGDTDIKTLTLNKSEIFEQDFVENQRIEVIAEANNPSGDTILYDYQVSAGKIIGQGNKVIWDLTGVKAGIYSITARADNGIGFEVGKSMTKTITIKP